MPTELGHCLGILLVERKGRLDSARSLQEECDSGRSGKLRPLVCCLRWGELEWGQ